MKKEYKNLKPHPALEFFPLVDQQTFDDLKKDIKANGLLHPILTCKGKIVDGRARLLACNDLGIDPTFEEVDGSETAISGMVVSLNLMRRHLSDSQRAMIAASIAKLNTGDNQHSKGAISQGKAAKQFNVSVDSIQRAKKVQETGSKALIKAVDAGDLDVANAAVVASLPVDDQEKLVAKGKHEILKVAKELNKAKKAGKRNERVLAIQAIRAKNQPLDSQGGCYEVIYADPPWNYLGKDATPYPTMSIREICAMPVKERSADNAALFLWCPASLIQEGLAVISAWGFEYKTGAVWRKGESGMGSYFRVNHEHLLFAVRGNLPLVADGSQPVSCFEEAKTEHSRKPKKAFEMIEAMYPELTKLELFCRGEPRADWHGWGNECVGAIDTPMHTEAANDAINPDIGDELMAAIGLPAENLKTVRAKRAA